MERVLPIATELEHLCSLDVNRTANAIRKTGIICTLGPSSDSVDVIRNLITAGMTIARLNLSYGTHEYHAEIINNIRKAVDSFPIRPVVAIGVDTKGPEIRTGVLADGVESVELKTGETICLTTDDIYKEKCTSSLLYINYKKLTMNLTPGRIIFFDDGSISLVVEKIENSRVICRVENGGKLGSGRAVNLPGSVIDLPAVSSEDVEDLKFAVEKNVDIIFASFIRNAKGVKKIRKYLGEEGKHIKIVSEIENEEGLINVDEIIRESDGIVVARGDLGVEIKAQKVFLIQKMIIAKCNRMGKPVICATQMLESMTTKPRPTRAEGTDVANAVSDGADCLMLSEETAIGKYPVESVEMMGKICREAETAMYQMNFYEELLRLTPIPLEVDDTMAVACVAAAVHARASAILVLTLTGGSAMLIAKYRPPCHIICIAEDEPVARQLLLWRGVIPMLHPKGHFQEWSHDAEKRVRFGLLIAKKRKYIQLGDKVVIVSGWLNGSGFTNTIRIIEASKEYLLKFG